MFLLLTLSKSFLFILCAFDACLPLNSDKSYLVRFQRLALSHDIGKYNFVSFHSGFIIIDFDEAADMQCQHAMLALFFLYVFLVRIFSWRAPGHRN